MRFETKKTFKIDLGNNEYVECYEALPYDKLEPIIIAIGDGTDSAKVSTAQLDLIRIAIHGWNILNDDGANVEYKPELVGKLTMETIVELAEILTEKYLLSKKKLTSLENPSEQKAIVTDTQI